MKKNVKYIGAHVSASGGVYKAVANAVAIGANAFALFTKNQMRWTDTPLTEKDIEKAAKGAKVEKGLAIHGSSVDNAKNAVEKWLK